MSAAPSSLSRPDHTVAVLAETLLAVALLVAPLAAQQAGEWHARREIGERFATPMIWDAARERLVMFGGLPEQFAGETWEMVGQTWTRRTPTVSPSPRRYHTMVFDSARRRALLFGGLVGPNPVGDTWEWDGADWRQLSPVTSPPPRWLAVMAFDDVRGRAVLFSGKDSAYLDLADTWEWNGANWSPGTPASSPPPRSEAVMVFDAARQRTLLFGGVQGSSPLGDTWNWDGTNWVRSLPATTPPARAAASIAYDDLRQRVVLFGGWQGSSTRLGDVWEWNGSNWIQPTTALLAGRQQGPAAYHPIKRRTIVHSGINANTNFRETVEWDGTSWHLVPPVTEPPQRTRAAMADGLGTPVLLFGGVPAGGGALLADTWEWSAARWHQRNPATSPAARMLTGMAPDPVRQRIVLFGGIAATAPSVRNDTWEWNGSTWVQAFPTTSPSPRAGHALAFDPTQNLVLLFGGSFSTLTSVTYFGDTWTYDGITWTQLSPASSPAPRTQHAMATDLLRQRIVLFGGISNSTFGDTWEWDGGNWTQVAVSGPGALFAHALAYDVDRGRTVLFAGSGSLGITDSTWEWDGSTWIQVFSPVSPAAVKEHSMAYDGELRRLVTYGGSYVRSTWLYGGFDDAAATPLGTGCAGSAGMPALAANDPFLGNAAGAVDLLHARANAPALIGFSVASTPQPLGNGCTLYLQTAAPFFVVTNADGFATLNLPLPFDPALRGFAFYAQGAILDPLGALPGAALTAALELRLGD